MNRGIFITFEGIDGSGKTTQVNLLMEYLKKSGVSAVLTSDTRGTDYALKMRSLIMEQKEKGNVDPINQALMFMSARVDVTEKVIKPNLAKGNWVICDRFVDGGLAYQGYGEQNQKLIDSYHKLVDYSLGNSMPDLTFILNLSVKQAAERVSCRGEKEVFEKDLAFLERVRKGYLDIAIKDKDRCMVLSASGCIEEVHNKIRTIVSDKFLERTLNPLYLRNLKEGKI